MNDYIAPPPLHRPEYPDVWVCPKTGEMVAKDLGKNMEGRVRLLEACEREEGVRSQVMECCRESILYWINQFVYTESFFMVDSQGISRTRPVKEYPFITWPAQDSLILQVEKSIDESESLLVEKSREVGASWCVLMVFLHKFLFSKQPVQFSALSLREADVDNVSGDVVNYPWGTVSDPSTLFGKLDYALRKLPPWMVPEVYRKRLQMVNMATRSRIEGSASATYALSSQRRNGLLMDEAAKTDNFRTIWQGTADVARCRLAISTPVGLGTFFTQLRNSGTVPVVELGWWQDPNKASDLSVVQIPGGHYCYSSNWYRHECALRTPADVASNLDIKHIESGSVFFPTAMLQTYAKSHCADPLLRLHIDFRPTVADAEIVGILNTRDVSKVRVTAAPNGPWRIWVSPQDAPSFTPLPDEFPFKPSFGGSLIFGVDVSLGVGASNSVISVFHRLTRSKIAEFVDARTPPHVLVRLACAAALWFGQTTRPLIVPEANGVPGYDFLRQLNNVYRYSNIYQEHGLLTKHDQKSDSLGYHSSRPKKAVLLGNLVRAYSLGNYHNPSQAAVDEAMAYVLNADGSLGPAELREESADAKATHGDRVIADALAIWPGNEQEAWREEKRLAIASRDIRNQVPQFDPKAKYPEGSMGYRFQHRDTLSLTGPRRKLEDVKPGERVNLRDFV